MNKKSHNWKCAQILDKNRNLMSGSNHILLEAIERAADLRIYTEFRHNEHIDITSNNTELVKEVSDFRITYVIDNKWCAAIMNLRQPIEVPVGFGMNPSMSFFLYNQDGSQAIARPYLDGQNRNGIGDKTKESLIDKMSKYHQLDAWDGATNAPSSNFVYDFDIYKFWVSDQWKKVYSNDKHGNVTYGSLNALVDSFSNGKEVKVGIKQLNNDLNIDSSSVDHEVFVHCGPCYYNTGRKLFSSGTQPIVRVKPSVPLKYESRNWDFGWLMVRSDGHVQMRLVNPYTLKFQDKGGRFAINWFVK